SPVPLGSGRGSPRNVRQARVPMVSSPSRRCCAKKERLQARPGGYSLSSSTLRVCLQEALGNRESEPRSIGNRYHTVLHLYRLLDEVVNHRIGAQGVFYNEARRRRSADMQPGKKAGRARPQMRRKAQVEGAGKNADPHGLTDAAAEGRIRLEDVGRLQHCQVAEREASRLALAGCNR